MIDFYEIAILKLKIIKESIKTFYLKEFIKIKRGIVDFVDKFFLVTLLILLGVYAIGEILEKKVNIHPKIAYKNNPEH